MSKHDKSVSYNPKADLKLRRKTSLVGGISDPIGEEVKDNRVNSSMYNGVPIVPFFDRADATLRFYRKLKELSPTHGSCISNQKAYVTGGGFCTVERQEAGFSHPEVEDIPAPLPDHNYFVKFITELNPDFRGESLTDIAKSVFDNLKTYGNAWLKVELIQVGNAKQVYLESIDCEKIRYLNPYDLEGYSETDEQTLVISPFSFQGDDLSEELEFVSEYPNFSDYGDGRRVTIISLQNKVAGRDWYGLPDSVQSLYFGKIETQSGEYMVQGYDSRWTGKIFLETAMDDDGEEDEDNFIDNMHALFTNKGEGRKILHRNRLPSDEKTEVHEFEDDSTHEAHDTYASIAERQIMKSHDWSLVLMGIPIPGKLGGNHEFSDVYKIKYKTVIKPLQSETLRPINRALKIAADFFGDKKALNFSLKLNNLFPEVFEETDEKETPKKESEKTTEEDASN